MQPYLLALRCYSLLFNHSDVVRVVACLQHEGIDSVGLLAEVVILVDGSLF